MLLPMSLTLILSAGVAVMLVSLAGVLTTWGVIGTWMSRNIRYLVTFALGVFIVIGYALLKEALHESTLFVVLVSMIGGIAVLEIGSLIIPTAHHHHGVEPYHEHSRIDARRILLGDAVHNISDGIILVPAFLISPQAGLVTTLGVLLHELVQEISEFFVLKEAGYSTKQALVRNFLVSATILIGIALGWFIVGIGTATGPLLGFAAGGFLYIVFRDLLPSTLRSIRTHTQTSSHVLALALGIVVMFGVGILTADTHTHGTHDEGAHHGHAH